MEGVPLDSHDDNKGETTHPPHTLKHPLAQRLKAWFRHGVAFFRWKKAVLMGFLRSSGIH